MHNSDTQAELSIKIKEIYEYCLSRMDPNTTVQVETQSDVEPPTMTATQTQLKARKGLVVTVLKETNTEIEEDTPLYRKNLQ